ncbi:MAG: archaeosortase/exosortase family protein [bacterium]|nr:MAG: archaeosortase/exosortase family protein [bacterium]
MIFFILWLFSFLLTRRFPGFVMELQYIVAREVAYCLRLLKYRFSLEGATFLFFTNHGGEKLIVIAECTGLYTSIIYFAIIGAYPARIGEKLIGLLLGIPAIHILNLARMIFISLILYHRRDLFDFFHGYLWQVSFAIFMLLLVILWMGKVVKVRRTHAEATAPEG